jgi:hypothetical protein
MTEQSAKPAGGRIRLPRAKCQTRRAGLRTRGLGLCRLLATPSQPFGQCDWWRSFPLTAAGQSRIHTGFPFKTPCGVTETRALYLVLCVVLYHNIRRAV